MGGDRHSMSALTVRTKSVLVQGPQVGERINAHEMHAMVQLSKGLRYLSGRKQHGRVIWGLRPNIWDTPMKNWARGEASV